MKRVLLISGDHHEGLRLASRWAQSGDTVTAVLLDAAAAVARSGHQDASLVTTAAAAGVVLLAHDDALRRRGVVQPAETVQTVALDAVADLLSKEPDRVMWT